MKLRDIQLRDQNRSALPGVEFVLPDRRFLRLDHRRSLALKMRQAAWQRLPQVVDELLRLRADVGARCGTRIGQTALREASSQGDAAITAMLIDAGADVNVCTWEGAKPGSPGISALGMAQQRGNVDVVQLLIAAGAQE